MHKRHRIFIAINLPEDIRKKLVSYQKKWPEITAKWVSSDNVHITLEFLGYITDQELGEVCMITKEVVKKYKSFSINLNKICYGPLKLLLGKSPKMIWAIGEEVKGLANLKNDLEKSLLEAVHFAPENRKFIPHITLARINEWEWKKIEPEERPEVDENMDLIFSVESVEVMESELKRGGPQYTILESFLFPE
ncbi:MAG: RNA 2',3'-cyclic phosphodiesterase [bacterium]|nr:RNA 2',3'-cyclic phosphodiesterase [bacterium]